MHGRRLIHRIVVATLLKGGLYTEEFAQSRDFSTGCYTPGLRHSNADIIDQSFTDKGDVLMRVDEQFAHGLRCRTLGADQAKPVDLLRRQDVLEEVEPVRFQ